MRALHITSTDASAASQAGTSTGDIPVWNATTGRFETLAKGSARTYLRTNAAGDPAWLVRPDFVPADHNLLTWSTDVHSVGVSAGALSTAGTVYLTKLHVPEASIVTNIIMMVSVAGATLTAGQCFAGLFQGGSLLGTTADQAAAWASAGDKTMPIAGGPIAVAAGDVYVAYFFNGTTGPQFRAGAVAFGALLNIGLAPTAARWGIANTGRTTSMPATLSAVIAASLGTIWAALS